MAQKQEDKYTGLEKVASDFMCYVCGALFNTDEDRRQHLKKEMYGRMREDTTMEEKETARY